MCREKKMGRGSLGSFRQTKQTVWILSRRDSRQLLTGDAKTQVYAWELYEKCSADGIDVSAILALPALHLPVLNKQRKCSKYCSKIE